MSSLIRTTSSILYDKLILNMGIISNLITNYMNDFNINSTDFFNMLARKFSSTV